MTRTTPMLVLATPGEANGYVDGQNTMGEPGSRSPPGGRPRERGTLTGKPDPLVRRNRQSRQRANDKHEPPRSGDRTPGEETMAHAAFDWRAKETLCRVEGLPRPTTNGRAAPLVGTQVQAREMGSGYRQVVRCGRGGFRRRELLVLFRPLVRHCIVRRRPVPSSRRPC